jgi:hypothetical protein
MIAFNVSDNADVCQVYLVLVDVLAVIETVDDYRIVFNPINNPKGRDT